MPRQIFMKQMLMFAALSGIIIGVLFQRREYAKFITASNSNSTRHSLKGCNEWQ